MNILFFLTITLWIWFTNGLHRFDFIQEFDSRYSASGSFKKVSVGVHVNMAPGSVPCLGCLYIFCFSVRSP